MIRTRELYSNSNLANPRVNNQSSANVNSKSAIGEKKRLKVNIIATTGISNLNTNVQINPKTWPNLRPDDLLEISLPTSLPVNSNSTTNTTNIGSTQLNNSLNRSSVNSSLISSASIPLSGQNANLNQHSSSTLQQQHSTGSSSEMDESSPFLVKLVESSFNDQIPQDTIRIDPAANAPPFSIKNFGFVNATVVDSSTVVLDLVELLFKDLYLNGNDMLRIKKYLEKNCVYLKKNIEFCGMRCTVREMWAHNGEIVTCGYISEKTRLAFRSQSAMCTIYIQMSREMWEFDVNGEMYHEKAINFLGELFVNWKNLNCQHDVTIALFSRTFYNAKSLSEFPSSIASDLKMDHHGRYYEDFYRVIYQNERYEDWTPTLVILKRLIKEYRDYIHNYHRHQLDLEGIHEPMPDCFLSSAPEGNFLETLNLSSSVFERHYIDRPFDRTGMMSLVITPGNGVFEANKELTRITKERVIDSGIGSDLVCLGEQPLHAVPLLKYDTAEPSYSIPHWINLSFYKSSETVRYCNSSFLPSSKIKVVNLNQKMLNSDNILPGYKPNKENYLKSLEETDNIFENLSAKKNNMDVQGGKKAIMPPSRVNTSSNFQNMNQQAQNNNSSSTPSASTVVSSSVSNKQLSTLSNKNTTRRFNNNPTASSSVLSSSFVKSEMANYMSTTNTSSSTNNQNASTMTAADDQNDDFDDDSSIEFESDNEQTFSSNTTQIDEINNGPNTNNTNSLKKFAINNNNSNKSTINPFMPSSIKPKTSFDRRRWAHLFPLRSDGTPMLPNWHTVQTNNAEATTPSSASSSLTNSKPIIINQRQYGAIASDQSSNIALNNNSFETTNSIFYNGTGLPKASPDSNKVYLNVPNRNIMSSMSRTDRQNLNSSIDLMNSTRKHLNNLSGKSKDWELFNLEESMATMKTGVAWKSLTIPSCLPLTTDFFPYKNFEKKFKCSSNYTLLLDAIREEYGYTNYSHEHNDISMEKVFNDLVGHRLAMGFQMVVPKNTYTNLSSNTNSSSTMSANFMRDLNITSSFIINKSSIKGYYKLSLGRIYHDLYYIVDSSTRSDYVQVEIYVPIQKNDKTNSKQTIDYKYRFQVPDSKTYDISYCDMSRKNIEHIKWNIIDSYICIQGNGNLTPNQLQKCWRQRLYLVPILYVSNSKLLAEQQARQQELLEYQNKNLKNVNESFNCFQNLIPSQIPSSYMDSKLKPVRCDIYQRKTLEELKFTRDFYFIKFLEGLNKLNRADEKRSFSRSTIAFHEAHNNNLTNCFNDMSIAVAALTNTINLHNTTSNSQNIHSNASTPNSLTTNSFNINNISNSNRSQMTSANQALNPSVKQQPIEKLASPKKHLYPLVAKYVSLTNSIQQQKQQQQLVPSSSYNSSFKSPNTSNETPLPASHLNLVQKLSNSSSSSSPGSSSAINTMQNDANKLKSEIVAILKNDYHGAMLNAQSGMPFIQNKKDIPLNCFISAEAVWWCIEHINEIDYEADAILFMQICSDFDIIRHISKEQKIFIHGFYLYYIVTENDDHHLYTKDYCEVGFVHIESAPNKKIDSLAETSNLVSVNDMIPESSKTLPISANEMFKSYTDLFGDLSSTDFSTKVSNDFNTKSPSEGIFKLVNVDVDPNHRSNRIEWASAIYRSHYHQLCAFELEILWEMATGSLLSDLITGYAKIANRFNFNLIAAPIDPFALPSVTNSDPLRGPIYIKLNLSCLFKQNSLFENVFNLIEFTTPKENETILDLINKQYPQFMHYLCKKYLESISKEWITKRMETDNEFLKQEFQTFIENKRMIHLQHFQEAILEKFGFIRGAAIVKTMSNDEDSFMFIHSSGGIFTLVSNCYNNFSNRSRHASSNSSSGITSTTRSTAKSSFIKTPSDSGIMTDVSSGPTRERSNTNRFTNFQKLQDEVAEKNEKEDEHKEKKKMSISLSIESDVGFLWSWNFMLGKRWRSQYTGDEAFQDNILADFRLFCSNKDERLENFYNEIKDFLL